jgi:hypothetical protein
MVERMDDKGAKQAIERPLAVFSASLGEHNQSTIESERVQAFLHQAPAGHVPVSDSVGPGSAARKLAMPDMRASQAQVDGNEQARAAGEGKAVVGRHQLPPPQKPSNQGGLTFSTELDVDGGSDRV